MYSVYRSNQKVIATKEGEGMNRKQIGEGTRAALEQAATVSIDSPPVLCGYMPSLSRAAA